MIGGVRYIEQTPSTLDLTMAIVPWGALEWHGEHLPFGVDGFIAEWFANELALRVGGTSFPVQWWAMTTLPHRFSLAISATTFRILVDETIASLFGAGFERVVIVTGHYAQGHMIELYEAARRAKGPVFVATPLEPLGDPSLLDHAGESEAAQMLAIRPDLVFADRFPSEIIAGRDAVLGSSPGSATAEFGQELLARGLDAWANWLSADKELGPHYEAAIDQYAEYRARYFRTSWEQAILDWWATKPTG